MNRRPNRQGQESAGASLRPVSWEDAALIERVQNGQSDAYGELVRKYQDRVFNTCWRICGHVEDARDLTQEAFLRAYERLADFRQESGFYTWMYRVAVNLALSHRREKGRRRSVSLEDVTDLRGTQAEGLSRDGGPGSGDDPAQRASDRELHGCVARALQNLDDDHRAVVVLRDIEGFDYREIAEILELPPGTVKSRLHRARTAIGEALRTKVVPERKAGSNHGAHES